MNTERPENETSQPTAPSGENLAGDTVSDDNFTVDDGEDEAPTDELPPVDEVAPASVEDTVSAPPAIPEPPPRRGGLAFSFLALLISLLALAGAGWMWWQDQSVDGQQDERVFAEIARLEGNDSELTLKLNRIRDELETLSASDSGAEFEAMQRRLEADRSKLGNLERAITEQLNQSRSLQSAADSMHGRLAAAEAALTGMTTTELDAGGELDIAEVDYLLRLANERLKLFSDPVAADQALEVADMHLAALDNPIYLGVRQDIADARRELAAVQMPDYLEITGELDSIQQEIASLPFHRSESPREAAGPEQEAGWWSKLKGVFSNLVTVRRSTSEENERISLQDKDLIRQRVWLQLEIAHLALMRKDQAAFRTSLTRAQASISTWFDPDDAKYQAVMKGIESLKTLEVQVEVPDITAPWSALSLLKASQSRPAPAPPAEAELPAVEAAPEEQQE